MGRKRRPVHDYRQSHDRQAPPQTRRAGDHQNDARRRISHRRHRERIDEVRLGPANHVGGRGTLQAAELGRPPSERSTSSRRKDRQAEVSGATRSPRCGVYGRRALAEALGGNGIRPPAASNLVVEDDARVHPARTAAADGMRAPEPTSLSFRRLPTTTGHMRSAGSGETPMVTLVMRVSCVET
jgi:hypothetical protein